MNRRTIAILRGGPSGEHEVSLSTGQSVIEALRDHHVVKDIVVDRAGNWTIDGVPIRPAQAVRMADVVFNAMHGEYGEDGTVQRILESLNVPFTGSRAVPSTLSMDKVQTKQKYVEHGLQTPHAKILTNNGNIHEMAVELFRTMPLPLILKPINKGSSIGTYVVKDFPGLVRGLEAVLEEHDQVLVEELIKGKEASVGVIDGFRDVQFYPLIPVEIRPPVEHEFYNYDCKYDGSTDIVCPGTFSESEKIRLQEAARKAHEILGLRHYSRTDFIIHPKRGIYLLETNSLPGLTAHSLLPKAIYEVGASYKDFLEHIIELAISGR